jgi:hypothetical protein
VGTVAISARPGVWRLSAAQWVLLGAVVVGAVLRVAGLGQALFGDELYSHAVVHGAGLGDLYDRIVATENTPPLYYVAARLTAHLGDDTVWLRLPSVLAGVAAIPLAGALGRRLAGEWAGALAAACVAGSPFLVYYSIEARAYMLALALTLGAVLLLLRALRDDDRLAWAAFALCSAAALYTHVVTAAVLTAAAAWALVAHRDRWQPLLLSAGAAVVLYVPWIPSVLAQGRGAGQFKLKGLSLLSPMGLCDLWAQPAHVLAGTPFAALDRVPGPTAWLVLGGLAVGLALLAARARDARLDRRVAVLMALCAAAPIAAGLAYGALTPYSIWFSRNLILLAPFLLALVAAGFALAPRAWLAGLVLLAVPWAIADARQLTDAVRPDQRAVARYVRAHAAPGDPIVLTPLLNTGDVLREDVRVYLPGWPALLAESTAAGPAVPGGADALPADRHVVVTGVYALGTEIAPELPDRKVVAERAFPGLYRVFARVYGPRETR